MLKELQDKKGFGDLKKYLSDPGRNFWDYFLELCVGYAFRDYNWQYEKIKLSEKFPDFYFCLGDMKVFAEVKNKNETKLDELEEIKLKILGALKKKPSKKHYDCKLDLYNFPADGEFSLVTYLKQITDAVAKISPETIKKDDRVTLLSKIWHSQKSRKEYEIKIVLQFLSESNEWRIIAYSETGMLNDYYTFQILNDLLKCSKGSFVNKFAARTSDMVTIGIIDVTDRESTSPIEKSFDTEVAKEMIKNIMGNKKASPDLVREDWFEEIREKTDAIFLIYGNHIKSGTSNFEKFFSNKVLQDKKEIIDEIHSHLITHWPKLSDGEFRGHNA